MKGAAEEVVAAAVAAAMAVEAEGAFSAAEVVEAAEDAR